MMGAIGNRGYSCRVVIVLEDSDDHRGGQGASSLARVLPQWGMEKLLNERKSKENFAVTSGDGSRDVMIVLGCGQSLNLELLAAPESPRSTRL